tara:strand:- start:707 stop:904 length:198 start_codon:yes stop_codon:yes gene_type:complete
MQDLPIDKYVEDINKILTDSEEYLNVKQLSDLKEELLNDVDNKLRNFYKDTYRSVFDAIKVIKEQ